MTTETANVRLRDMSDAAFEAAYGCDRFTASVLGSRFRYIVKHMCTHLMTNAFSPILRDWYDFSATVSGPPEQDYPMAAVSNSLMIFSGTMGDAVRITVEEFGAENLQPGDVLVCNDPYRTGTHVNDTLFVRPAFHEGRLIGFVNIQPHMMDMGGVVPAGFSGNKRNVYENGLVLPPMLLYREDRLVRSSLSLIFDNARFGEIMLPDIQSVFADLRLGERLLLESVERYGVEPYLGAIRYATDVSADAMRAAILALPDGVYEGEDLVDCDGIDDSEEYLVKAKVTIAGSRIEIDLSGTSRQARTSINCGWLDVRTSVAVSMKFLLEPTSPFSSGAYRDVDIVLPPGTICSALPPDGAIFCYWEPACALMSAIFQALAPALGPNAIGGDATSMIHNANGVYPDGRPWASAAVAGGEHGPWGATRYGDAESSLVVYSSNGIAPAVEAIEADAPVVLLRKQYATDSSGPGAHRGGASTIKDSLWRTAADHYAIAWKLKRAKGFGVSGGGTGSPGGIWMWEGGSGTTDFVGTEPAAYSSATVIAGVADPDTHLLDPVGGEYFRGERRAVWQLPPETVFRYHTCGGGGWGNPLEREPSLVLRDVRDEYVSVAAARDVYGVIVEGDPEHDPEGLRIDVEATATLRERRRHEV